MRNKILLLILLFICTINLKAQNKLTINGTIYDEKNETIPFANIYLKNSPGVGVVSDINGKFSIVGIKNDFIVVSFIGYENYEHRIVKNIDNLQIKLKPETTTLEETVIIGMGSQKKVSVVGAISSIKTTDLEVPAVSLNNVIGGKVPGIISIQESGEPGKDISDFWIRGIGTFGANSKALVLIDGLEGELNQVDPADIADFSILKDASATAIYGVKGANGVVIIKTKRGEEGKMKITARTNITLSYLNRKPKYLQGYDYALLANEAAIVSNQDPIYSQMELDLIKYNLDPDLYPNVNWQKEILKDVSWKKTAYTSLSGGNKVTRYFISLGASNEDAIYKQDSDSKYHQKNGYTTYNYRTNLDIYITNNTKLYFGVDGFISKYQKPGLQNTKLLWDAQSRITPLTVPIKYSNGQLPAYDTGNMVSPYVLLNYTGYGVEETYKNLTTLALNHDFSKLIKGLNLNIQGAFYNNSNFEESRTKMPACYMASERSSNGKLLLVKKVDESPIEYKNQEEQDKKYELKTTLNYNRLFKQKHRVGGLLYYYMTSQKKSNVNTSMAAIPKRYQGISGRITYSYNDIYHIDGNFGYTGSENFKPGQQFGFFPSIAIGWTPTSYQYFQKNVQWLDYLKFRFSIGQAGNDKIANKRFPYLTIVEQTEHAGWGHDKGITETVVGADNLKWEKATKTNFGLEANMFKNKLSFVVDVFNDQRDGIFQQRTQVPDYVGVIDMPYGNVGSMKSYGSDGNISYTYDFNKNTSITLRANFTYATNEVQHWEQVFPKYEYQKIEGNPLNTLDGYIAIGLFKDEKDIQTSPSQFGNLRPGDIKYRDVNGDGVINTDDKVPLSYSPIPRLLYGCGMQFNYKKLSLNILLKGTGDTDFFYEGYGYIPFHGEKVGNILSIVNDKKNRWIPSEYSGTKETENQNARFPRLTYGKNQNNTQLSTFYLGNSKYIRLKEISLNYHYASAKLNQLFNINSIDFQLIGHNLYVWDDVKLFDPELAKQNGNAYPIPSKISFQIYMKF